ncbi:uncharacterized protein LOC128219604 isoform X2 [Mya arenaria]|uniref:uncharacterized protein LOC128219604 isoform X2 n=1 Tax=Mya arenaria TaxID=6604 RepID=UPI0022DF8A03|nr:uncharacterized protein LOC128219604 isoform X2 [Mya arenaria]
MRWNRISYCCLWIALIADCLCQDDTLELHAFEYLRRFERELLPGQCPGRIIQQSSLKPYPEPCMYPNRPGDVDLKRKPAETAFKMVVDNPEQLMDKLGLCDAKAAHYFGLLANGDCVSNEIAGKVSFSSRNLVLLNMDHYRPRVKTLHPSAGLGIPDEYTHYFINSYYTRAIAIGTEEVILVVLSFKSQQEARLARQEYYSKDLSTLILNFAMTVNQPTKIKVVRLSTADKVFETKVFRSGFATFEAAQYVEEAENHMDRIRKELDQGVRHSHLKYSFKAYEVGPMMPIANEQKSGAWKQIALVQVRAKRMYNSNKRYRKFCRSTNDYRKYCLLENQTLKELKKTITRVHTMRRDWLDKPYEYQIEYINNTKKNLKLWNDRLRLVSKQLRKIIKKTKTKTLQSNTRLVLKS